MHIRKKKKSLDFRNTLRHCLVMYPSVCVAVCVAVCDCECIVDVWRKDPKAEHNGQELYWPFYDTDRQNVTYIPWMRLCKLMVHSLVITSLVTVFLFSRRRLGAIFWKIIILNQRKWRWRLSNLSHCESAVFNFYRNKYRVKIISLNVKLEADHQHWWWSIFWDYYTIVAGRFCL